MSRTLRCPHVTKETQCTERIPRDNFACREHWISLPTAARRDIKEAWMNGTVHDHADAVKIALDWWQGHP